MENRYTGEGEQTPPEHSADNPDAVAAARILKLDADYDALEERLRQEGIELSGSYAVSDEAYLVAFSELEVEIRALRDVYGEEWTPDIEARFRQELNQGLAVADATSRIHGYHNKLHPVEFAKAWIAQCIALKGLLNQSSAGTPEGQDSAKQQLNRFIRGRLDAGTPGFCTYLVPGETDEDTMRWKKDSVEVDAIDVLKEEFGPGLVVDGVALALMHDACEITAGKRFHEDAIVGALSSSGKIYLPPGGQFETERVIEVSPSVRERAAMILSTKYFIPGYRNPLPTDKYEWVKDNDSIALWLATGMFSAGDFVEMFARESYVSLGWVDNLTYTPGKHNSYEFRLAFIEGCMASLDKEERARAGSEMWEAWNDYPLFALWMEEIMFNPYVALRHDYSIFEKMTNPAFIRMMHGIHESSFDLIEESDVIPDTIKTRFGHKEFENIEDRRVALRERVDSLLCRTVAAAVNIDTLSNYLVECYVGDTKGPPDQPEQLPGKPPPPSPLPDYVARLNLRRYLHKPIGEDGRPNTEDLQQAVRLFLRDKYVSETEYIKAHPEDVFMEHKLKEVFVNENDAILTEANRERLEKEGYVIRIIQATV